MYKALLFAGTTEGRQLAEYLAACGVQTTVSVATEYGQTLIAPCPNLSVHAGRLDEGQMEQFLKENRFDFVIDATHPYAAVVTQNICRACAAAEVPCYRCLREESQLQAGNLIRVETTEQAVQRLNEMPGNILLTTGSKELAAYTKVSGFAERVYPRVLPLTNVVESCLKLGVPASHLIAMQGPFSEELNLAMIRQWNIACLVTKESGRAGGVDQKVSAAQKAGIAVLLIGRPQESEQSFPLEGLKAQLRDRWGICPQQEPKTSLPYFPLFVPLAGKRVQVFGAGKIAARRIRSLLGFGCTIEVIAPQLDESLEQDALQGRMVWHQRPWQPGDCAGDLVLAATDDHAVNRQIVKECRQKGILSNRCDCREDCDFYFPALVQAEGLTIGLCSNGEDHKKVKGAAAWLREAIAQREKKE